jgi:hypothetical protein
MVINIYDKWLAAPLKCGTRYLAKLGLNSITSNVNELMKPINNPYSELEWFVIRNPIEHLQSAMHTECLPHLDNPDEIKRVLKSFTESYTGGTHYHIHLYSKIYDYWCRSKYSFKFVELTRLSYVLENRGYHYPYYPDDYTFGYFGDKWKSKEDVFEIIKCDYRTQWDELMSYANKDLRFYENCQSEVKKLM